MDIEKWNIRVVRFLSMIIGAIILLLGAYGAIAYHTLSIVMGLFIFCGILLVLPYTRIKDKSIVFSMLILYAICIIMLILGIFSTNYITIYVVALAIILLNLWAFLRTNSCVKQWKIYRIRWIWIAILALFFSTIGIKKLIGTINLPWINEINEYEDNWMD